MIVVVWYLYSFLNKIEIMEIEDCYGLAEIRQASTSKKISNFNSKLSI